MSERENQADIDRSNVASVLCSAAGNLGLLEYTIDNLTMDRVPHDIKARLRALIVTIGKCARMANELANGIDMDTTPEPWLWGLSEANSPEPAKPQSFEDLCEREAAKVY